MVLYPEAEVRLYDAGRFALEDYAQEIAGAIRDFLGCRVLQTSPTTP